MRWFNLKAWFVIGMVAVASWTLVSAQQPPAPAPPPDGGPFTGSGPGGGARQEPGQNQMSNPFRMIENWPALNPGMKWGAAINFLPDQKGGTWALLRTEPPIVHFDTSGKIAHSFGNGMFVSGHGMCRDRDGNIWAGDSGPFGDVAGAAGKGFVVYKFSPEGKLLLTLGKLGVSQAGQDTFVGPTSCAILPNGDVIIGDGHWPRPSTAQQDGDRLVRYTTSGKFVARLRQARTRRGRVHGPACPGRRFTRPAVRRRPLEQPDPDLRQGHELSRFVEALRAPERHHHPEGRHDHRRRLRVGHPPRRPGQRRSRAARARSSATSAGSRGFASAARATARSTISSKGRTPREWPPTRTGRSSRD